MSDVEVWGDSEHAGTHTLTHSSHPYAAGMHRLPIGLCLDRQIICRSYPHPSPDSTFPSE